jgi:hypothetical protein
MTVWHLHDEGWQAVLLVAAEKNTVWQVNNAHHNFEPDVTS